MMVLIDKSTLTVLLYGYITRVIPASFNPGIVDPSPNIQRYGAPASFVLYILLPYRAPVVDMTWSIDILLGHPLGDGEVVTPVFTSALGDVLMLLKSLNLEMHLLERCLYWWVVVCCDSSEECRGTE